MRIARFGGSIWKCYKRASNVSRDVEWPYSAEVCAYLVEFNIETGDAFWWRKCLNNRWTPGCFHQEGSRFCLWGGEIARRHTRLLTQCRDAQVSPRIHTYTALYTHTHTQNHNTLFSYSLAALDTCNRIKPRGHAKLRKRPLKSTWIQSNTSHLSWNQLWWWCACVEQ